MPDMPVPRMPGTRNAPNTPPMTPDTPDIWDSPCTPPSTPDPTTLPLPSSTSDPSSPSSTPDTPDPPSTTYRSSTPYPSNTSDPFGIPRTSCLTKDCSSKSSNSALYAEGESGNITTGGDITTFNWRILLHQMNDEKKVKVKKVQEINTTEPRRMKRRRDESDEFTRPPPNRGFQLNELKEEKEEELEELDYS